MVKKQKGFTLIELLIVVAIIAILAAIAIPNFLQAQVRSKVARAQADMATLGTAIEAYYIDNNDYPSPYLSYVNGSWTNSNPDAVNEGPWNDYTWAGTPLCLSTPIAYITQTYLLDPFGVNYNNSYHFFDNSLINDDDTLQWWYHAPNGIGDLFYPSYTGEVNISKQWVLYSNGPCLNDELGLTAYDPTNGTVSNGNIDRFGP